MTSKSPVGDISVVTLIRTDTTLDHSQKAEKVCVTETNTPVCAWGSAYLLCTRHDHGVDTNTSCDGALSVRSVGSSSQADYLMRNAAMDDSIGGS